MSGSLNNFDQFLVSLLKNNQKAINQPQSITNKSMMQLGGQKTKQKSILEQIQYLQQKLNSIP